MTFKRFFHIFLSPGFPASCLARPYGHRKPCCSIFWENRKKSVWLLGQRREHIVSSPAMLTRGDVVGTIVGQMRQHLVQTLFAVNEFGCVSNVPWGRLIQKITCENVCNSHVLHAGTQECAKVTKMQQKRFQRHVLLVPDGVVMGDECQPPRWPAE